MYRNIQYQKPKSPDEKLPFNESISGRCSGLLSSWRAIQNNPMGGMADVVFTASPDEDIVGTDTVERRRPSLIAMREPVSGGRDCLWIFLKKYSQDESGKTGQP